jgi:hypothetical protein
MKMQTRSQPNTASFTSRFFLLLMVAGVVDIDSGYDDHKIFHRIEILFQAARFDTQSPVVAIAEGISGYTDAKKRPADFYECRPGVVLFSLQNAGRVNTRGFYSSHIETASFNIPHQNSDEDDAFVYPDVA